MRRAGESPALLPNNKEDKMITCDNCETEISPSEYKCSKTYQVETICDWLVGQIDGMAALSGLDGWIGGAIKAIEHDAQDCLDRQMGAIAIANDMTTDHIDPAVASPSCYALLQYARML